MDDKLVHERYIDVVLAEYHELREELRLKMQAQYTMMTLMVSAIGIIFGFSVSAYEKGGLGAVRSLCFLFCLALPSAVMFCGIMWLDQVYRQTMIALYITSIEKKVNGFLNVPDSQEAAGLYWEQWMSSMNYSEHFFKKANHYYYYICLGLFLTMPVAIALFGLVVVDWEFQLTTVAEWAILIIVYITFLLFIIQYVKKIMACKEGDLRQLKSSETVSTTKSI